jgi:hypothetical protein
MQPCLTHTHTHTHTAAYGCCAWVSRPGVSSAHQVEPTAPFTCADNDGTEERLLVRQHEYFTAVKEYEIVKRVSYGAFLAVMAFMTGLGKG